MVMEEEYVGRRVKKEFEGYGTFTGTVKSYDPSTGYFEIVYDDGDFEDLDLKELNSLLLTEQQQQPSFAAELVLENSAAQSPSSSRPGRKPKRRRAGKSCNFMRNRGQLDLLDLNKGLVNVDVREEIDLNVDLSKDAVVGIDINCQGQNSNPLNSKKAGFIDLNLDLNEAAVEEEMKVEAEDGKKERDFDLNLGYCDVDDGGYMVGISYEGEGANGNSNVVEEVGEDGGEVAKAYGDDEIPPKGRGRGRGRKRRKVLDTDNLGSASNVGVDVTSSSTPQMTGRGRGRKRKNLDLDSLSAGAGATTTGAPVETGLRRSSRRARKSVISDEDYVVLPGSKRFNDALVGSPSVSALSEVERYVEVLPPPKVELPPSSENLGLEVADRINMLDLFSVYSFLRSFSTLLFLSPFELEDFVGSIKCNGPTILFDSVHVSLLQTIRRHLESLVDNEGSESASICLRSLNWDLLDLITWPLFMVEYLLLHSSGSTPGFDICCIKLFEIDYYKQPARVKLEILRCLCDDVIETEAVRLEVNRRMLATDPGPDIDRSTKPERSRKRKAATDAAAVSCLTEEEQIEQSTDWNSDECCLCKMDGNLICCDGCPSAFHSRCVGVTSSLLPEGDWYCPECVMDRHKVCLKAGKSIRGAELLGTDPYGRLYYSSCGYLLVSNACDSDPSFKYYHRNDLPSVIEALSSSGFLYRSISNVISKHWDVSFGVNPAKTDLDSGSYTARSDSVVKEQVPKMAPPGCCGLDESINKGKINETAMASMSAEAGIEVPNSNLVSDSVYHTLKTENRLASSEGSSEVSQGVPGIQNSTDPNFSNRNSGTSDDPETPGELVNVQDCPLSPKSLLAKHEEDNNSPGRIQSLLTIQQEDNVQGHYGPIYVNCYNLARTASLVADEIIQQSSEKVSEGAIRTQEEIIAGQLKVLVSKSTDFYWPNIQNLNAHARKEKCGWCFSCRVPEEEGECLFMISDSGRALELFTDDIFNLSGRQIKCHLLDVICYVLGTEDRLRGLLRGPWLDPQYSNHWRENVLSKCDIVSVKKALLTLESNLSHLALSADWLKHVDLVATMGSASHVITSSLRVSAKHGISRKKLKLAVTGNEPSSNSATGLSLFWWRGGKISRHLFNWKGLPRSLASKAARQGGRKKIPGLLYPEGSDFAKRCNNVAWRAAVETTKSVEQLAFRVRELDAHIRWDDIANSNLRSLLDKDSKKSFRSFRKCIIRRKSSEGPTVKYLLDFGKRRFIPDVVVRHGARVEDDSSERKKYWLEESHVPLHLLRNFEEKRIARKSCKMVSEKLCDGEHITKSSEKKKGFSYLFAKAERTEYYICGHCNKDVLIREAVNCQDCEGFFHRKHVKKSIGVGAAECAYTCYKCRVKISLKSTGSERQKSKSKKAAKVSRPLNSGIRKKATKGKRPVKSQAKKAKVVVPLRRSLRRANSLAVQSNNAETGKKDGKIKGKKVKKQKNTESRKRTMKFLDKVVRKKRTQMSYSIWLNGLLYSGKPDDKRVIHFRNKELLVLSGEPVEIADQPKCSLCAEPEFKDTLNYVGCQVCGDWFHGDAFGLKADKVDNLIGFACHKCRNRPPPICPCLGMARSAERCGEQICPSYEMSEDSVMVLESNDEKQLPEAVSLSKQVLQMDGNDGHLPLGSEQDTEAVGNSKDKDGGTLGQLPVSNENMMVEKSNGLGKDNDEATRTVESESDYPSLI